MSEDNRLAAGAAPLPSDAEAELREALEAMRAFVGVMFGAGPDATIPETVPSPLGIPVKVGAIMRRADAALSIHERAANTVEPPYPFGRAP